MSNKLAERVATTPMEMIQVAFSEAIKQGSAMEVVNSILEQQKWMIQHSEEEAFNAALKRIQRRLKAIPKHGENKETHSKFATSADIDREIQVLLDDESMTLSFRPGISDKADMVLVTGILSLGAFTKEYPLEMPADGKGAKGGGVMSRTHATGAAITYAKRYLKNMIFDLRFEETDDDGNSASGVKIPSEKVGEWLKSINEETELKELMKTWGKVYITATELGDQNAKDIIGPAYEKRKAELQNEEKK